MGYTWLAGVVRSYDRGETRNGGRRTGDGIAVARSKNAAANRLFDRQALALIAVIFLTEAGIAVIFFSLVQQYPAHLLSHVRAYRGRHAELLREAAAYAGYALSAYGIAKLPAQPLSGWLADRFGSRRLLLFEVALSILVVLAMEAAPTLALFVATCALYGIAIAVVWPAVFALIGDRYEPSVRGRIVSAISGAQLAGSAAGFAAGAFVIDYASFAAAFGLALGLNAAALVFGLTQTRTAPNTPTAKPEAQGAGLGQTLRALLAPNLVVLSLILVLISVATTVLAPDLKPYSSSILHLRFSTFSVLLAIPAVVAVLTLIPSGVIVDRFGRTMPMLVAVSLWPLSIVALSFSRGTPLALFFASIAAFAYALGLPAWSASLIDLSSAGSRGVQVGAASALQAIGLAIGPAVGGQTIAALGPLAPFRLSAALMLLAALLTLVYRARAGGLYRAPPRAGPTPLPVARPTSHRPR
jgi:MFS family permease